MPLAQAIAPIGIAVLDGQLTRSPATVNSTFAKRLRAPLSLADESTAQLYRRSHV